jgi:hypothetical protein
MVLNPTVPITDFEAPSLDLLLSECFSLWETLLLSFVWVLKNGEDATLTPTEIATS